MTDDEKRVRIGEVVKAIKPLAAEYYRLTRKPLGVTGELAEYAAAEALGLTLVSAGTPGHDALRGAERIQIKGRSFTGKSSGQRIGLLKADTLCDTVLVVVLNPETLDPHEMWEAEFAGVKAKLASLTPLAQARGLPLETFKKLARRVWPSRTTG